MNVEAKNYFDSGNLLKAEGKFDAAISSYQKALELQPDYAEVYNPLAEIYFSQGKLTEAIASCQLALKLQPNFAAAYKTLGNALQAQGKIEQAIRAYSKALELNPEFAEAHVNIGSMLSRQGQLQEAITRFQTAIALKPDLAAAYWNLGNALVHQGKTDEAVSYWQKAAEYKPEQFSAETFNQQGMNWRQQGKGEEAIACFQRAIALNPNDLLARLNLGTTLQQRGDLDEAIALFQEAFTLQPADTSSQEHLRVILQQLGNILKHQDRFEEAIEYWQKALESSPEIVSAEILNDLGTALGQKGEYEEAIACYQRAINLKPNYPLVYLNLGTSLQQQGKLDEAVAQFCKAIALQPDSWEAYRKLGNAFNQQEKFEEAIAAFQKAIQIQPRSAQTHFNLGTALLQREKLPDAIAALQTAIKLQPDHAEAYYTMGTALHWQLKQLGQMDLTLFNQALSSFQKAIEINPNFSAAHLGLSDLINNPFPGNNSFAPLREAADNYLQNCNETSKLIAAITFIGIYLKSGLYQVAKEKFLEIEPQIYKTELSPQEVSSLYISLLFNLSYLRDDLAANTKLFKFIGEQYVEKVINPKRIQSPRIPSSKQRSNQLRIGILSSHFGRHSVGWCSADVIQDLSQLTPYLYLYSTNNNLLDDRTKLFEKASAKFYRPQKIINGIADSQEIIEEILKDELDVLIDLDSLTAPIQVDIIHQQPAPLCLSWLGFEPPFTTPNNYFLCDRNTHPDGTEQYYCERLIRMSNSFVAVAGFEAKPVERKSVRRGLRIAEDQVVYLCMAPGYKLNPDLIKSQVKILQQVPDSVLIYKGHTGDSEVIQSAYNDECKLQGVGFHRIKFLPLARTEEEHRTTYQIADILLDSYPYNGATHTLEALWFNLPVVTRMGEQYLSRMSYSFLQALSLSEGVTRNWEDYAELGIQFGKDVQLRQRIQEHLLQSKQPEHLAPLWNPKKFAQDMYAELEKLVKG